MVRVRESNIFFFLCICRPSLCPSRYLLLNLWVEFNQTCYITSPHGKGVQEQHHFLCVRPCVCHLSICLSCYFLLNHSVEFNQTCYITSPDGKGVREQHFFFPCVRRPSICPLGYHLLNHWVEFNQTCFITSPHGKGVQEQHYFSVCPSSLRLSVTLSPPKPLVGIQPNLLHQFPS